MNVEFDADHGSDVPVSKRLAYATPRLTDLGTVKMMTQSGSGLTTENTTGNPSNPCTQNRNAAPCIP